MTAEQRQQLGDILDSGPVAYGLDSGIWTSPMIAWVIEEEFGVSIIRAMCASCCYGWASPCSGRAACWRAPTPRAGSLAPTHLSATLKKSPSAELGADLHRRSQLPAGLDVARHLEPRGASAGSSGHGRTQEREDSGRPSNSGARGSITARTRSSMPPPTWASWNNWRGDTAAKEPF